MQKFKGDSEELKMIACAEPVLNDMSVQKDLFFAGAYTCFVFGDLIYDESIAPLSRAISKTIFRESFNEIFQSFRSAGTFESYLSVFHKIFGAAATITFTVPAAGKLTISIVANDLEYSDFVARHIEDNAYVFDNVITYADEQIVFQTIKGFHSQYELEQMLFEMVPGGIYTVITLTLG